MSHRSSHKFYTVIAQFASDSKLETTVVIATFGFIAHAHDPSRFTRSLSSSSSPFDGFY